jgi:hypothetical protein
MVVVRKSVPVASMRASFAANAVAIVAAMLFRWRLHDLVTLYWLEIVFLAGLTVVQMWRSTGIGAFAKSRGYLTILFVTHYGTFCVVYRAFIVQWFDAAAAADWYWLVVWVPFIALAAAHIVSFRRDYLVNEAAVVSPFDVMWIPYLRELPVHLPIIVGLVIAGSNSVGLAPVVVFGVAKTLLDAGAHAFYHARLVPRRAGRQSI